MNLTFEALVEQLRERPPEEKEQLRYLLERWLVQERRQEVFRHYEQSQAELKEGKLGFSKDHVRLKTWLAGE